MDLENLNISKTTLIIILAVIIIISFLGINLFLIIGTLLNKIIELLKPFFVSVFSLFGYTLGSTINSAADISSTAATTGVDIAKGTVQSVGNLLKTSSSNTVDPQVKNALDNKINNDPKKESFIDNDNSYHSLQNPISCNKSNNSLCSKSNNYVLLNDPPISLTGHKINIS
jgi:hypothetical protein